MNKIVREGLNNGYGLLFMMRKVRLHHDNFKGIDNGWFLTPQIQFRNVQGATSIALVAFLSQVNENDTAINEINPLIVSTHGTL